MFAFLPNIGVPELIVLLLLGVLLFGRKLPDIGRSLGKTVTEFKKGFSGVEEEITTTSSRAVEPEAVKPPQRVTPTTSAPKFDDAPVSNLPPTV